MNCYISEIIALLKNFLPNHSAIEIVKRHKNIVLSVIYRSEKIFIKVSPTRNRMDVFNTERIILPFAKKQGLNVPEICSYFPKFIGGYCMIATKEIRGNTLRKEINIGDNQDCTLLRSWIKEKSKLHNIPIDKVSELISEDIYSEQQQKKWMENLSRSRELIGLHYSEVNLAFHKIINELRSHNEHIVLGQGDPTLENAIVTPGRRIALIDFEDVYIGDPLWDIFGNIRDFSIIYKHINQLKDEYSKLNNYWSERRVKLIICLSSIDWLSKLWQAQHRIERGDIRRITIREIHKKGINVFDEFKCIAEQR